MLYYWRLCEVRADEVKSLFTKTKERTRYQRYINKRVLFRSLFRVPAVFLSPRLPAHTHDLTSTSEGQDEDRVHRQSDQTPGGAVRGHGLSCGGGASAGGEEHRAERGDGEGEFEKTSSLPYFWNHFNVILKIWVVITHWAQWVLFELVSEKSVK